MENTLKKKVKLNRFQILILYFLLFACIGWIMETLYAIYNLGHFVKRGFLYGPICPIYGYGALILIMFFINTKITILNFLFMQLLFFPYLNIQ